MEQLIALIDIDYETHSVTLEIEREGQLTQILEEANRPFKVDQVYGAYWDYRMAGWIIPEMNRIRQSPLHRKEGFDSQTQFEF